MYGVIQYLHMYTHETHNFVRKNWIMNHIECFPSSLLNKNASSDRYISHCKSNAFHLNSFSMNFYIKHYCLLGALVSRLLIRTKQVFIFIKPCIYIFVYLCMYFIIYLRYLSKFFSM